MKIKNVEHTIYVLADWESYNNEGEPIHVGTEAHMRSNGNGNTWFYGDVSFNTYGVIISNNDDGSSTLYPWHAIYRIDRKIVDDEPWKSEFNEPRPVRVFTNE